MGSRLTPMHASDLPHDLQRRSLAAVWHPCTQMKHHESLPLVPVARGDGWALAHREPNRPELEATSSATTR